MLGEASDLIAYIAEETDIDAPRKGDVPLTF
jgi:hypothetical protein